MTEILGIVAEAFDLPILDWIQANLQCAFLDWLMPVITLFGDGGIFWIACALAMMCIPKYRKTGFSMGAALLMGVVICNMIMKPLVGRIRPYDYQITYLHRTWEDLLVSGRLLVSTPSDFSFPSGHTIASFEACTAILIRNRKLGIPAVILAILIAFSRLYLYVHYPTDVLVSLVLGIAFGILGSWLVNLVMAKLEAKKTKPAA